MNAELRIAIDELQTRPADRAWFIPVVLDDCEPPDLPIRGGETLRDIQYLRLGDDWETGLGRLIAAIVRNGSEPVDASNVLKRDTLRDRVLATLAGGVAAASHDDYIAFALDRTQEPHLRVLAIERLREGSPTAKAVPRALVEVAGNLQTDAVAPVAKAAVDLARQLIAAGVTDLSLLLPGAASGQWEVVARVVATASDFDDLEVLALYRAASVNLTYWRPMYTLLDHIDRLAPGMDEDHRRASLEIVTILLRNPKWSEKGRLRLQETRRRLTQRPLRRPACPCRRASLRRSPRRRSRTYADR